MRKLSFVILSLLIAATCIAHDAALAGWARLPRPGGVAMYSNPSNAAVIVVTEAAVSADIGRLAQGFRQTSVPKCPGLSDAPTSRVLAGRALQVRSAHNGRTSSIVYRSSSAVKIVILRLEQEFSGLNTETKCLALLSSRLALGALETSAPVASEVHPPLKSHAPAAGAASDAAADAALLNAVRIFRSRTTRALPSNDGSMK